MNGAATQTAPAQVSTDTVSPFLKLGVFFCAYLSWRPSMAIMFTLSDACLLIGLILLLLRQRMPLQPFGVLSPLWFSGFLVMMTALLLSSLFISNDPTRWAPIATQYAMAWVVMPFLLTGFSEGDTHRLARAYLAGVVTMELVGIIVYFTFDGSFEDARAILGLDFISGSGRLGSFATDANWNGAVISMTLPFVLYLGGKGLIRQWQTVAAIAILVFALTLTASFTAFGASCVAVALFLLAGGLRLRPGPVLCAMALFAVVGGIGLGTFGLPPVFQKRVAGAIETGNLSEAGTFEGRLGLIQDAWQRVGDSMVLGVGADQDRVVSPLRAPVHNMYLLLWVEGGFLSLLGWLMMMAAGLSIALAAFMRDRRRGALALTVLSSFLLFSTASPHMYARLWAVPVLLAIAIAIHSGEAQLRDLARRRSDRRFGRVVKSPS